MLRKSFFCYFYCWVFQVSLNFMSRINFFNVRLNHIWSITAVGQIKVVHVQNNVAFSQISLKWPVLSFYVFIFSLKLSVQLSLPRRKTPCSLVLYFYYYILFYFLLLLLSFIFHFWQGIPHLLGALSFEHSIFVHHFSELHSPICDAIREKGPLGALTHEP